MSCGIAQVADYIMMTKAMRFSYTQGGNPTTN